MENSLNDIGIVVLAIIGSALAGAINTLAGNGSAITLTLLTQVLGLPPSIANATNRVGIVAQSAVGSYVFFKNKKLDLKTNRVEILLAILGSVIGIVLAIEVSNEQFFSVFKFLMVLMLLVILVKPEKWIRPVEGSNRIPRWVMYILFFAIGIYGGFIQMGMGIFFLAISVLGAKKNLVLSNGLKIAMVGFYTLLAVIIFQIKGMIIWDVALIFALGQTIGGYYAARFATSHPAANLWAYRLLVLIVIVAVGQLFGILEIIQKWLS